MRVFRLLVVVWLGNCASHSAPRPNKADRPPASGAAATTQTDSVGAHSAMSGGAEGRESARANAWREAHRLIDVHTHIDASSERMAQALRVMNAVGIGLAVNLSGGTVTHAPGQPSQLEYTKRLADDAFPGRFVQYMNLDYTDWDAPDFAQQAVAQVEQGARLGAAGFKEFKRLGLFLRDRKGQLLNVDDPKLDPMWHRLGQLGMPVSIHVADPKAFWGKFDRSNERWNELEDHPRWWFGDPMRYPLRDDLLAQLERVVARHPETTFVCVHLANNAEDLDWVDAQLSAHPNMMADVAARVPEIGRHDPERVRALFTKHADRILFGTDFQVGDEMTLGSGGSGPPPTEADAIEFFRTHWRFFETADSHFPHMTPIQGGWTISGVHLGEDVLAKIYFENAKRLLAHSLVRRDN
ncbi:MAG: amidohydrolase family protein [Myxococcota bacterium]|nr:amidohydrolase family protein [Myxococcota bacterium]